MRTLSVATLALLSASCVGRHEPITPAPRADVVGVAMPSAAVDTMLVVPPRRPVPPPVPDSTPARDSTRAPTTTALEVADGEATYYAAKFDGRRTASGIVFHNSEPFAAHRTYPFGTVVRVTNTRNDKSVVLRVVDRGPNGTAENKRRTIIDVSHSAAQALGFVSAGRTPVRVEVLEWGTSRR